MPFGLDSKDWTAAKREITLILESTARRSDPLITYSDLAKKITSVTVGPESKAFHELLGEISADENGAGRGMLSALVVHKDDRQPGPGFFALAKKLGRVVSNKDIFWIDEIKKVQSVFAHSALRSKTQIVAGHTLETLSFNIPPYPQPSHPISRGTPKFYKPESLRDSGVGETDRTRFFERILVGMYFRLGRAVPYAFLTLDGEVRSLDAGCLKFLANRKPSEIEFHCSNVGEIESVTPTTLLIDRYSQDISLFEEFAADLPLPELPFRLDSSSDHRRRKISEIIVRDGGAAFRLTVLWAWRNRCAVTGTAITEVVEAAHIYPYDGTRTNEPYNGIALRSDIHTLFDSYLISFRYAGNSLLIQTSKTLAGTEYERFSSEKVVLPERLSHQPHPDLVNDHFGKFCALENSR